VKEPTGLYGQPLQYTASDERKALARKAAEALLKLNHTVPVEIQRGMVVATAFCNGESTSTECASAAEAIHYLVYGKYGKGGMDEYGTMSPERLAYLMVKDVLDSDAIVETVTTTRN
jgi:hypothetical protein